MRFNQEQFRAIVSGRRKDAGARLARCLLGAAALGYRLAVGLRNRLYDRRWLRSHRAKVTVVCVGNLTAGGTGKTPLVAWLCRYLGEKNIRGAILTRGYKMQEGEPSDEPALLAAQCPGVGVVVNPDRVAGAAEAISCHGAQVLVMDDGFQHRRLSRDLDIVAIDATQPFGYGKVLPAGLLREPVTGLRRAHAVVLTRCDQVSQEALEHIESDIRRVSQNLVVVRSSHMPVRIETRHGTQIGLDELRDQRVLAFCGIGNPASFFQTVERLGGVLVSSIAYDDHHHYSPGDLEQIHRQAVAQGAALVLTTQKDWTKIASWTAAPGAVPLAYLAVELRITSGGETLTALIDRVVAGIIRPH